MDGVVLILDTDDINELEKNRLAYDAQDPDLKILSDNEAIRIYGKTNVTRYEEIKAAIASNINRDAPTTDIVGSVEYVKENSDYEDDDEVGFFTDYSVKVEKAIQDELDFGTILVYVPIWNVEDDEDVTQALDKLNKKYDMFNILEESRKELSNTHAITIFGVDNYILYHKIKAKLLEDTFGKLSSIDAEDVSYRSTISFEFASRPYDMPYYEAIVKEAYETGDQKKINTCIDSLNAALFTGYSEEIPEIVPNLFPDEIVDSGVFNRNDLPEQDLFFFENYKKGIFMDSLCYKKLVEFYFSKMDSDNETSTQKLLEYGWNPSVSPTKKNFMIARENMQLYMESKLKNVKVVNLSRYTLDSEDMVSEMSKFDPDLHPVFIVCCYTGSLIGKAIRKATDARYSHAAIGFDSDLNTLYSYNLNTPKRHGGLSFESITEYISNNDQADIFVGVTFLNDHDYKKMRSNVDWYIANYDKASYDILSLFAILLNRSKNLKYQLNLVCSQFVDNLFKLINIDLTDKSSSLVTPKDLSNPKDGSNVFILYQGLAKEYDSKVIDKKIYKLIDKVKRPIENKDFKKILLSDNIKSIEEASLFYNDLVVKPLQERTFALKIDNDTITINTPKDFENEYQKSHKLLIEYDKSKSFEPMKHELAKLWFINVALEAKLQNDNSTEVRNLRSRILNDFKKYIKVVLEKEPDFDFTKYYDNTGYSDTNLKIDKGTTLELVTLLKNILKRI